MKGPAYYCPECGEVRQREEAGITAYLLMRDGRVLVLPHTRGWLTTVQSHCTGGIIADPAKDRAP